MSHEHHYGSCHRALHLSFEITKLLLKGVAAAAAICMAKNLYKVHKSIEAHHK